MDIGEVTKITKLPASTLRYYEEKGLIKSLGRHGLRRYFAPNIIEKLALITLGKNVGLSLNEISKMLIPSGVNIDRKLLNSKADELDKKIIEMTAIRDGLRSASACKAENHLECPTFRRLLNISAQKKAKA
jgi:DNA-binding transcriptional MerR regulator